MNSEKIDRLKVFCERLNDLISEEFGTIKAFSQKTGISLSRLYDYSNGTHAPSLANGVKIAAAFGCTLDYLFGFADDFTPKVRERKGDVHERVKSAFDSCNTTRYKLSEVMSISEEQLSRWYHGTKTPNLVSLITLAEHLNCSLDYLSGY